MTALEKLTATLRTQNNEQLTALYIDTIRMRLGTLPRIAPVAELGILLRETEHEMTRRSLDVDALCDAVYGPDDNDQDLDDEKAQERRWSTER